MKRQILLSLFVCFQYEEVRDLVDQTKKETDHHFVFGHYPTRLLPSVVQNEISLGRIFWRIWATYKCVATPCLRNNIQTVVFIFCFVLIVLHFLVVALRCCDINSKVGLS